MDIDTAFIKNILGPRISEGDKELALLMYALFRESRVVFMKSLRLGGLCEEEIKEIVEGFEVIEEICCR